MKTYTIEITADDLLFAPHVPGYSAREILRRACQRAGLTSVSVYTDEIETAEGRAAIPAYILSMLKGGTFDPWKFDLVFSNDEEDMGPRYYDPSCNRCEGGQGPECVMCYE